MTFVVPPGSVLVTSPLLLVMQQYGVLIPLGGPPVGLGSFCSGSWTSRLWGKVGGFVWGVGEYRYCVGIARDRACTRARTWSCEMANTRAHVACGVFLPNTRERTREQGCREEEMFTYTTPLLSIDVHFYDSGDGTAQRTARLSTPCIPAHCMHIRITGTLANLVAGDQIGFALSYAVGQSF